MTTAHFDRFDICAAWNLYLQHHWKGPSDPLYRRHENLRKSFTPSRAEETLDGLSENALEIYTALCAKAGTLTRVEHPIANMPFDGSTLFCMWAGDGDSSVQVYVWADHFEDAFEVLVEWLDDNAPGCLVSHEEAKQALEDHCQEHHGMSPEDAIELYGEISDVYEAVERANDWTVIGHTSLNNGGHIRSDEWGGDEIMHDDAVRLASTETYAEHWRAEAVSECERAFKTSTAGWGDIPQIVRHSALLNLLCQGVAS